MCRGCPETLHGFFVEPLTESACLGNSAPRRGGVCMVHTTQLSGYHFRVAGQSSMLAKVHLLSSGSAAA
jgi:hypothetical protein